MPIVFTSLPAHLQVAAVEKMEARDFIDFKRSSTHANAISGKIKRKVTLESDIRLDYIITKGNEFLKLKLFHFVDICCLGVPRSYLSMAKPTCSFTKLSKLPVRISAKVISFMPELDNATCSHLIRCLRETNTSGECLELHQIDCSRTKFKRLLKTSRAKKIFCTVRGVDIPPHFSLLSEVQQLSELRIQSKIDDRLFLLLKGSSLRLMATLVSSAGINEFLKQWLRGEREILSRWTGPSREFWKKKVNVFM